MHNRKATALIDTASTASDSDTRRLLRDLEAIFRRLELTEERNELIREIDEAILRSTFSPQEVLDLIVEKCLAKSGASHGQVVRYRRNRLVVAASTARDHVGEELPLEKSLCGMAVLADDDKHYPDICTLPPARYVRFHPETKSELVVLIKSAGSARILGVLDLERDELGAFDSNSQVFAHLLAGQAAIAIEHARIWTGVRTLYEIGTELLSGSVSLEDSYQRILDAILEGFDFAHGQILLLVGSELVIVASSGKDDLGLRVGPDNSICGKYLLDEQHQEILVIDDVETSDYREFYLALLVSQEGRGMRSEFIVPLIENGHLMGALNVESPQPKSFSDLDVNLFGLLGPLMAKAIGATTKRTTQEQQERIDAANLAMTYLGNVAQSFLHDFGGDIGDSRGKLLELGKHLANCAIPPLRDGDVSVAAFIEDISGTLTDARTVIENFSNRFNPDRPLFRPRLMDLAEIANTAVQTARDECAGSSIDVTFAKHLRVEEMTARRAVSSSTMCLLTEQVYDVVENLINNAVRAVREKEPADKGQVRVVVDLPHPLRVRVTVQDNGVGIRDSEKPRVFDFGYTTKRAAGRAQGIGLWFCRLYSLQRGGDITFESEEGIGSTFEVQFPAASQENKISL